MGMSTNEVVVRPLVEPASTWDVPHRFHEAVAHRDILVPPVYGAVLYIGEEDEPVTRAQWNRTVGPQDQVVLLQGIDSHVGHAFHNGERVWRRREAPVAHVSNRDSWA